MTALSLETAPLETLTPAPRRSFRQTLSAIVWGISSATEWLFGLGCVLLGLAVLAAIPIAQFLTLGYLLEATGRVARSGRLRDGFIGVRTVAHLGGIVIAVWVLLIPVRFLADLALSASIIDPGSTTARAWRGGLFVLIAFTALHILCAVAKGGRLRYFLWPFNFIGVIRRIRRGGFYVEARDAVWDTVMRLRLPYYFWLGLRGFAGALVWLVIPVTLLAIGQVKAPLAPLVGFVGAFALAWVLMYLPFLQTRMAQQNRFWAIFDRRAVRDDFVRAPWLSAFAFVILLAFALPLYLLKIEVVPSEAAWLPSLVFIAFIYPSRLLVGWAVGRAQFRETPRHWFYLWTGRLLFVPAALFYVMVVFFTQYTSWNGIGSLYEQHIFLLPVPFVGM